MIVECSTVTWEFKKSISRGFCSVERFWIELHFDKFLAVNISLRKGVMEKINCNHEIMKGEDLEVCTFKYCSIEQKEEEVLEEIKYVGKLYHLIREIFWDCMVV